jgi:signal transduction histidine kinase
MTLYARLALSILAQRREREGRMMTMEALAASIAHEINQPLAAVVGNGSAGLRWLDRPVPDLSEARASLQRVVRDGHRAAEAIESIRSLFRAANQEKSPIFINAIILEALDLVGAELRSEGVQLVTDLAADLPMMSANKSQLQQVMLNLITNAVEAMRPITDRARVLKVSSRFVSGQSVLIDVADTGTGIEPKNVDGLFDAFSRQSPMARAWAWRSAAPSSRPTADGYRQRPTSPKALSFGSRCRSRTRRHRTRSHWPPSRH